MITSSNCNKCKYRLICAFKSEYESAVREVEDLYFLVDGDVKVLKNSRVEVVMSCPYIPESEG